jgi:hypothetical protein
MQHACSLSVAVVLSIVLTFLAGCTASQPSPPITNASPEVLPGISNYYARATAHQPRAVRKPIRDQRERAWRELAKASATLLARTETCESDAELVSAVNGGPTIRQQALQDFRDSLHGLKSAAERSDLPALRAEYARATASYRIIRTRGDPAK